MWSMTPGEFTDFSVGVVERDREHRLMLARAATAFGGDAYALIGEVAPGYSDPDDVEAWTRDDPNAMKEKRQNAYEAAQAALARDRDERHRQYMPAALRSRTGG
jgi:hypothetical protein